MTLLALWLGGFQGLSDVFNDVIVMFDTDTKANHLWSNARSCLLSFG